jgi:hypothetical protein
MPATFAKASAAKDAESIYLKTLIFGMPDAELLLFEELLCKMPDADLIYSKTFIFRMPDAQLLLFEELYCKMPDGKLIYSNHLSGRI